MFKREFEVAANIDWTTVLVALFTGVSAAGGPIWIAYRQTKNERASVRSALLSEVAALVEIVELRGYLPDLRNAQQYLKALDGEQLAKQNPDDFTAAVPVPIEYNMVYRANLTRLGGLSRLEANQLVRFHQLIDSVRVDISEGGVLYTGSTNHVAFGEAADLLETALGIGRALIAPAKPAWWNPKFWRRE